MPFPCPRVGQSCKWKHFGMNCHRDCYSLTSLQLFLQRRSEPFPLQTSQTRLKWQNETVAHFFFKSKVMDILQKRETKHIYGY